MRAALFFCLAALSCSAPDEFAVAVVDQSIVGGQLAAADAWSSAVATLSCSAVLISPNMVVTAAHCLARSAPDRIWIGESRSEARRIVGVSACHYHPEFTRIWGNDIGYCQLSENVTDVEIAPIVSPAEASEWLVPGATVTIVGFGDIDAHTSGGAVKRWAEVAIDGLQPQGREIVVGTRVAGACNGDSGGPAYLKLGDGSWRVVGVASRMGPSADGAAVTDCDGTSIYTSLAAHEAWLEQSVAPAAPQSDAERAGGASCTVGGARARGNSLLPVMHLGAAAAFLTRRIRRHARK